MGCNGSGGFPAGPCCCGGDSKGNPCGGDTGGFEDDSGESRCGCARDVGGGGGRASTSELVGGRDPGRGWDGVCEVGGMILRGSRGGTPA